MWIPIKIDNPREGTETFVSKAMYALRPDNIKIDNPREGTETICSLSYIWYSLIKIDNPREGTETSNVDWLTVEVQTLK